MRNHYQALSDCAIRIAIAHESKEQNAIKNGDSATAENSRLLAMHYRNESRKCLQDVEKLNEEV
tara:strand:- start:1262 stop:1453 length:192 start_codon:yes stop_codon:yes gene_type:complete